ncbi:MAG: hypothetical protein MUE84_02715 [Hyphomonas sp.]|nr:hypothetical protein [Hyphomonas sp.]
MHRLSVPALFFSASVLALGSCTSVPKGPLAADGTLCPGVATYDVEAIRAQNAGTPERAARIAELVADTPLPPGAEVAATRIRVRVPPGGLSGLDTRVTLWKDQSGVWQIATNNRDSHAPPPQPVPRDENGNVYPGYEYLLEAHKPKPPYLTSPLDAANAAKVEAALADACFSAAPDRIPYDVPLRKKSESGQTSWLCPPDSAFYSAEVQIPGEPPRYISHACYIDFATSKFLSLTAYLEAAPAPAAD